MKLRKTRRISGEGEVTLAQVNGVAAVFEWDVDENGNAKGTTYEWK